MIDLLLAAIVIALLQLYLIQRSAMNDLTQLQTVVDNLEAKVNETVDTLRGLAQEIVDLKQAGNQQEAIDALAVRAQGILDNLTDAEDAADNHLPGAGEPQPE